MDGSLTFGVRKGSRMVQKKAPDQIHETIESPRSPKYNDLSLIKENNA